MRRVYFRMPRLVCERASSSDPGLVPKVEMDGKVEEGRIGGEMLDGDRPRGEKAGNPVGCIDEENDALSNCVLEDDRRGRAALLSVEVDWESK